MANVISYASIFQTELDKQMVAESTSGWMELNSNLVKYNGGKEIKIPKITMDGLGNYSREEGFTKGSSNFSYETHTFAQDRARTFTIDRNDVDETNFALTAGVMMGEFQRTKVIPEVDAYRFSKIATKAIAGSNAVGGYTAVSSDILDKLLADIYAVQDIIGESEPLVVTLNMSIGAVLDLSDKLQKRLDVIDFKQGEVSLKVKALDGIPIIKVPSARMKTAYTFYDGTTSGQEVGGFVPAGTAKDINWLITARKSCIGITKTDIPRIFDPATNQTHDGWKIDYRKYYDLIIPDNKVDGIYANIKQALA